MEKGLNSVPTNMFIHHDVPVHNTPLSKQYMAIATIDTLKDPSYSPDPAVNRPVYTHSFSHSFGVYAPSEHAESVSVNAQPAETPGA